MAVDDERCQNFGVVESPDAYKEPRFERGRGTEARGEDTEEMPREYSADIILLKS